MVMKQRKDKVPVLLAAGACFLCWLFVMRLGIFGSKIDWISQHSVLPDYFRQLFYETGNLFPNFAPNLGGGQNIYNFSYYGLYNPIILISYLFPFVEMSDYIIISSICCYCISVVLFYLWIRKKCEKRILAVGISCIFGLATPLIYHSYNQIMFVNYMMFLCLALIGTDYYLEKKRSGLLIIGVFCMIMTSFYFSIGGLLVLVLYGSSEYFRKTERLTLSGFFSCGMGYLFRLGVGILMSGILLIPTIHSLGGGRTQKIAIGAEWFLPEFHPFRILYSPYGLGLSTFALTVLISGLFYRNWRERLLSLEILILLCFPVFGYLLNGGLYSKDKVFIPCLPVICYLIVLYLNQLKDGGKRLRFLIPYVITFVLIFSSRSDDGFSDYWIYAIVESVLMLIIFGVCIYFKKTVFLPYLVGGILVIIGYGINTNANVSVTEEFYQNVTSDSYQGLIAQVADQDTSYYRMEEFGGHEENKANINRVHDLNQYISSIYSSAYNNSYQEFRNKTFGLNEPFRNGMMQSVTNNPLFLRLMGVKYLITDTPPAGYTLFLEKDGYKIWKNDSAAPVIYATNRLITEDIYKEMEFPLNQTSLLDTAVVPEGHGTDGGEMAKTTPVFEASKFELPEVDKENLRIIPVEDGYEIIADEAVKIKADIGLEEAEDLMAISFDVENRNPSQDMYIKVDKQSNRLTAQQHAYANHNTKFTYLMSLKPGSGQVTIKLGKGHYRIYNVKAYGGSENRLQDTGLYQNQFQMDRSQSKGDRIQGTIMASKGSYLITSIPFDKGFTILVDGEPVTAEVVNTGFLGCELSEGTHQITILFRAEGFWLGVTVSLLGILLFLGVMYLSRKTDSGYLEQNHRI